MLTKQIIRTVLQEARPASPARSAIAGTMYLPPSPLGSFYSFGAGGAPGNVSLDGGGESIAWPSLRQQPAFRTVKVPVPRTPQFVRLSQVTSGSVTLPPGATPWLTLVDDPVFGPANTLIGYLLPTGYDSVDTNQPVDPTWHGPPPGAKFIKFPSVMGNGYPDGAVGSEVVGTITAETDAGPVTISRRFKIGPDRLLPMDTAVPDGWKAQTAYGMVRSPALPARPAQPAQPEIAELNYNVGWNAGAVGQFDPDAEELLPQAESCYVEFESEIRVGGACGLIPDTTEQVTSPSQIPYGWQFTRLMKSGDGGGYLRAQPMLAGRQFGTARSVTPGDSFRIERVAGVVSFKKNGNVVAVAPAVSIGPLLVGAALYRGGDAIP